jgi:hypothetical protein
VVESCEEGRGSKSAFEGNNSGAKALMLMTPTITVQAAKNNHPISNKYRSLMAFVQGHEDDCCSSPCLKK